MTDIPSPKVLWFIAKIMLPTVLACAWLLHKVLGTRYSMPPPPSSKTRKRPTDMGPETRMMDRL
jgi:hypothetical protein